MRAGGSLKVARNRTAIGAGVAKMRSSTSPRRAAPSSLPTPTDMPFRSLSAGTARRALIATSASKAWNLSGLEAAQLVLSDAAGADHRARVGFLFGQGASTLGVLAASTGYEEGGEWLDGVLTYLDGKRRLLSDLLAERLPEVRYRPPEAATWPGWTAGRSVSSARPASFFLEKAGIALVDGPECGAPGKGHVRLTAPPALRCSPRWSTGWRLRPGHPEVVVTGSRRSR